MATNNLVILIGNLGDDPSVHQTREGKEFLRVTIATTDAYKDKKTEQWVDLPTVWHTCFAFNEYAKRDTAAFRKGQRVRIIARLTYSKSKVQMEKETLTFSEAILNIRKIEMAALSRKSYAKDTTGQLPAEAKDAASDIPSMNVDFEALDIPMDGDMPEWEPDDYSAHLEEDEALVTDLQEKPAKKGKAK
jgi:single-strand DNA-binding protein